MKTILIVDDNIVNIRMLVKILSDEYNIIEAYNGKDALNILKENKIDISAIMLDIIMPVMDGYQLLGEMKKVHCSSKNRQ